MKRKRYEVPPILDSENIEHVIYARKSTEDEEKQKESIPQQLDYCFSYSKNNNISIQARPENEPYSKEIIHQIQEAFENNPKKMVEIRAWYISHYVVCETKSARVPAARPAWAELVKQVKIGKIRGLFGYAPDRFSRNLQEGGEIIQLVEQRLLKLKFTNFAFENNASGHMMLGIFFVFAEHYSKKLSEDSLRGSKQKTNEGRAQGVSKYGYTSDAESQYFTPHPTDFAIMRKAFERKIYDNWTDVAIAQEIVNNPKWQGKENLTGKDFTQTDIWNDPFFYGVWRREFKDDPCYEVDLRSLSGYNFKPLISYEEFVLLQEQLFDTKRQSRKKWATRKGKDLEQIKPLSRGVVTNEKGAAMNPNLPNPKRFQNKLKKDESLIDIVQPHQIRFSIAKKTLGQSNAIDWETLEKFIFRYLKQFKITEEAKQAYLYTVHMELESVLNHQESIRKNLQLVKNKANAKYRDFQKNSNYGQGLTGKPKQEWEKENQRFESRIAELNKEELEIHKDGRNRLIEQQAFTELMLNLPKLWKKANYVQKRKICDLLVLNISVKAEKPHGIKLHADFEDFFSGLVAEAGFEPTTFGL